MELFNLYFKGLPVKISLKRCISAPEDFFLANSADPDGISSSSSLFAKVPAYRYPE